MRYFLFLLTLFLSVNVSALTKLDSLKKQLVITTDLADRGKVLASIGSIAYTKANYDEAAACFTESIQIFEKVKDTVSLYRSYGTLGMILSASGDNRRGLFYLNKSLDMMRGQNDTLSYVRGLNAIGTIYDNLDEMDSAYYFYLRAEEMKQLLGDSSELAVSRVNLGHYFEKENDLRSSVRHYLKGISYVEPLAKRSNLPARKKLQAQSVHEHLLANLGDAYVNVGETDSAIFYLEQATKLNYEYSSIRAQKIVHKGLSDAYKEKGDFEQSLHYYQKYEALKDSVLNEEKINSINEVTVRFETEKKEAENTALKLQNQLANENLILQDQKLNLGYTLLIIVGIMSLGLLIIIIVLISRNRLIKKLNIEMQQKNEKLNEAKQKIELKALLNQINPHFIFNVLNSIQQFVLKNDSQSSLSYFNRFGSLIRSSLEHSEKRFVPLQEEIEVIQNYVTLENLRFEEPIVLRIKSGAIDTYNVKIPPMFIQPLVENAILHGLSAKEGERKLEIGFEEEEEAILCKVHDNGIGRDKEKMQESKKRNSGLSISRKRLKSIWMRAENDISFEDLVDQNLQARGTVAHIKLPKSF
ncbi:MAG: histidine kinase [Flavobacteriales bacterium]|nr:histidine kinase [Flavobacteriales bacterium]